jgi:hypothetical protein
VIRAAPGHDVDDCARIPAVLCLVIRQHAQLGYRVNRENRRRIAEYTRLIDGRLIAETVIHVGAVKQEVVGAAAGAVHRELAKRSWRVGDLVGRTGHAGIEIDKLGVVASVNRQIVDRTGSDRAAQLGGGRLDVAQVLARDFHSLRHLAGFQVRVYTTLGSHVHCDAVGDCSLEASQRYGDRVCADGQLRDGVAAVAAGYGRALQPSGLVAHFDCRSGHECSGGISHGAKDCPTKGLAYEHGRRKQKEHHQ